MAAINLAILGVTARNWTRINKCQMPGENHKKLLVPLES